MKECKILKWEQIKQKSKGKAMEKVDEETITVMTVHDNMFVFCNDDHVNIICYDSD